MSESSISEAFDGADLSQMTDLHSLESDRLQVFWILAAIKKTGTIDSVTADEVSTLLRDRFGIAVYRQRVAGILESEKGGAVTRIGKKSPARYKLMRAGEDEISATDTQALFIDPANALSSIRKVEAIFALLAGDLLICDTYVDSKTIDYLALAQHATSIKLLTANVQDASRFRRDLAAFAKQHKIPIEVRQGTGLHDRYVIYPAGMLMIGSSIKDVGKKQSLVVKLPTSFAVEMTAAFYRVWRASPKFV